MAAGSSLVYADSPTQWNKYCKNAVLSDHSVSFHRWQSSPHEGAATEISDSSKGWLLTALFRVPFAFHVHFMYNQQSYHSLQSIQYDMGLGKLFILPKSQFDSSSVGLMIMPCSISVRINKVTHTECRMVLGTWQPSISNRTFFFFKAP